MGGPIARCAIDKFSCPKQDPGLYIYPATMPVTRLVDGLPVARLGDIGVCNGDLPDLVIEGSLGMLVCGLPIARQGDAMKHGGTISTGSPNEQDGSPSWRLPANIKLGGSAVFQSNVVRDLFGLSQTPTGAATLNAITANGQDVYIVPGGYNSSSPDDRPAVTKGGKSGTTINYDADKADLGAVCKEGCLPISPQLALGHELIHAARWGRGGATLDNGTEEKQVIGPPYGKKDGAPNWPTENGLRKDLGMGTRTKYDSCTPAQSAKNQRPGQCP
jgi:uncharacterized Zn-binding protein involved in type VI secretion